jgi:predicted hydrocarbon binding protein
MAGQLYAMEGKRRDWNAVEMKCIGLGDSHCEVVLSPGRMDDLESYLCRDTNTLFDINQRLVELMVAAILNRDPTPKRADFDDFVHLHVSFHAYGFPHIAGRRAQTAVRMGGANAGRLVAQQLLEAGLEPEQVLEKLVTYLEQTKVGIVHADESRIRIEENIEPLRTFYMTEIREPACFFTTGFFNGVYNALFKKHVLEVRCLAAGDSHCEWEVR